MGNEMMVCGVCRFLEFAPDDCPCVDILATIKEELDRWNKLDDFKKTFGCRFGEKKEK
jgi:hypothetical protein